LFLRVLGMGDVLSLIERAEQTVDLKQAAELERKLRRSEFTLEDFRDPVAPDPQDGADRAGAWDVAENRPAGEFTEGRASRRIAF